MTDSFRTICIVLMSLTGVALCIRCFILSEKVDSQAAEIERLKMRIRLVREEQNQKSQG